MTSDFAFVGWSRSPTVFTLQDRGDQNNWWRLCNYSRRENVLEVRNELLIRLYGRLMSLRDGLVIPVREKWRSPVARLTAAMDIDDELRRIDEVMMLENKHWEPAPRAQAWSSHVAATT